MPTDAEFMEAIRASKSDPTIHSVYADWLEEQGRLVDVAYHRWTAALVAYRNVAGYEGQGVWRPRKLWDELGFLTAVEQGELSDPISPTARKITGYFPPWQVKPKRLVWKKWLRLAGMEECSPTRKNMIACRDALLERREAKQAGRLTKGLVTKREKKVIHEDGKRLLAAMNEMEKKYLKIRYEIDGIPPGIYIGVSCRIIPGDRYLPQLMARQRGLHASQLRKKLKELLET